MYKPRINPITGKIEIADTPTKLSDLTDDATHRTVTDTEKSTWNGKQDALGYTPENVTNKSIDVSLDGASDVKYPSVKSVKTYVDNIVLGLLDYRGSYDASTNLFPATGGSGLAGAVLKGDFWVCSVAGNLGTVAVTPGDLIIALVDTPAQLAVNWDLIEHDIGYAPENVANKKTDLADNSDTFYPSQKAVKTAVDAKQNTMTKAIGSDIDTGTDDEKYVTAKAIADSSIVMKGDYTTLYDSTPSACNLSSEGSYYTDTVGNTYGETASQTRLTMPNKVIYCGMKVSGHVSAGTGTYALYNVTDAIALNTVTTTALTETSLGGRFSRQSTNANDLITIKLKNSSAGARVYIDAGGLFYGDGYFEITASGTLNTLNGGNSPGHSGYMRKMNIILVRGLSTATLTASLRVLTYPGAGYGLDGQYSVRDLDGSLNGIPTNVPLSVKIPHVASTTIGINVTALVGHWAGAVSFDYCVDNI